MSKVTQQISLKQQLTPQQVLKASLLQLSIPLLEQRILYELETNPALELIEPSDDIEVDGSLDEDSNLEENVEFEWEELLGLNDDYEYPKKNNKINEDYKAPLVASESFSEKIIKKLQDSNMNKKELDISEQVLGNLDEQGYLTIEPSLISDRMHIDEESVINVINKIQRLDPPGLAAYSIQDCLRIQAEVAGQNLEAITVLTDHFDDFVNHRYEKIMKAMDCSKEELNKAMEFISKLNPSPRDEQNVVNPDIIFPDVSVENRGGKFHVIVQDGSLPDICINKSYINMLTQHKDEKDVKKFIKNKLESAEWFIDAIKQRKKTIQLVMESIIKHQEDYFYSNKRNLKPMILKDIAEDINMDISSVSRVTNGKFVQLPWEIKELKTFFSEGVKMKTGELVSSTEVKEYIIKIIDMENKNNPLSDDELTKLLNKAGYKIARRTTAKYRENLKISTARLRRKL